MKPEEAAHVTMREVGGALISIAIALCAVFVPSAFLSGITGQFFRQFAVTISASTVISCLVSLDPEPGACAVLFKPISLTTSAARRWIVRLVQAGFRPLQRWVPVAVASYGRLTRRLVRIFGVVLVVYSALIGIAGFQFVARAHRLHSGAGSGLSHHGRAAAARRHARPHGGRGQAGDRHHPDDTRRRACRAVRRARRDHLHHRIECRHDLFRPAVAVQS